MKRDDIHRLLREALAEAAPDSDVHLIDPALPLQAQVQLDPVRWISFFAAVQDRLGIDLSETDTGLLCTLEQLGHHCEEKLASRA